MKQSKDIMMVVTLLVLIGMTTVGCQKKVATPQENVAVNSTLIKVNITQTNQTNSSLNVTYTEDQRRKLNITRDLYLDYISYINAHDANLSMQLKLVRNKTIDKIVDPVLQEKLDKLHDNIVSNYTAEEVQNFGFEELLWEIYDVDDALNPKNVTIVNIRANTTSEPAFEPYNNKPIAGA